MRAEAADVTDVGELKRALERNPGQPSRLILAASTRGGTVEDYTAVYLRAAENLLNLLPGVPALFVSSTSVYAQKEGEEVDENSPAEPSSATGRVLRKSEELILSCGGAVVRLAGLYGPGRSVLLRKYLKGEARLEGDGSRWVNMVHVEDAATALMTLLSEVPAAVASQVFNAAARPVKQINLFSEIARRLGQPLPGCVAPDLNRKRGWSNKRVLSHKLRGLGWRPKYEDYFADWERLLSSERAALGGGCC